MALTIYFKDGSYIDDCLIDSILHEPESNTIKFTDRFGKEQTRKFTSISCIVIKGVASYENNQPQ